MGTIGFEEQLWASADKLRNNMDASEYKHVVLGLIFLKYVSDTFMEKWEELMQDDPDFAEDRDEYLAEGIFWVPENARWNYISEKAKLPEIGSIIDTALDSIEKENDSLRGVLPKNYSRPELDKRILGEIVDLFTNINVGGTIAREKDILGRVYEYFLGKFAANEGKGGGEFYTPKSIVTLMVEMIEPYKGYVYDPACGSGGMFVQSLKFVQEHSGNAFDISVYGQESNPTTWKLAKMNMAIRGIENNLGSKNADTFHEDLHSSLKADYILANPPFNQSDWGQPLLVNDPRWKFGTPPSGNANYGWIEHMIDKLSQRGKAAVVLANGSLSSNTSNEGEIRKNILEADLVDAIVALPDKLFYTTGIPVCIWFFNRDKKNKGKTLFIDARKMGTMVNRRLRELNDDDIKEVAKVYHAYKKSEGYEDKQGFCKKATLEEIRANDYILTPGRYVGIEEAEDDGEPFDEKMDRLTKTLSEQFKRSKELEEEIRKQLGGIGYLI
ncbi:class I SAM-dependent DNA methyltransferase [Clostridium tertium]|uniref:class I SAM-dependent DNA methyltransferase n=1 Tax=Clostridium tertium TaxID=1559 RepID=UPI00233140CB|nr:class I SAM-dependent DNA methyltransferase [Clostridium tertium]MDB1954225.1 class I SAM-dependent DNA methyltransferase [Clostridium tertium]MDB1957862.1 class I SAM-dependent DNA methyltransferase [Clostridium tertium]MDB1961686.1 class I SAM-dependent DNA methyltransferase [Clostridium tertium]MDB1965029.1 class I SAM-dependent DNA methyltransferase [Clostridium tertium]